jgi:hypothetical protein
MTAEATVEYKPSIDKTPTTYAVQYDDDQFFSNSNAETTFEFLGSILCLLLIIYLSPVMSCDGSHHDEAIGEHPALSLGV